MATYQYSRCPYCNNYLTFHQRSEASSFDRYIGLQYARCPHCNSIYSTGKKLYNQMTPQEKQRLDGIAISNIISTVITFFVLSSFVAFIILSLLLNDAIGSIAIGIFIVCFLISIPVGYLVSKSNYESFKKLTIDNFSIDNELRQVNIRGISSNIDVPSSEDDPALTELLKKLDK